MTLQSITKVMCFRSIMAQSSRLPFSANFLHLPFSCELSKTGVQIDQQDPVCEASANLAILGSAILMEAVSDSIAFNRVHHADSHRYRKSLQSSDAGIFRQKTHLSKM